MGGDSIKTFAVTADSEGNLCVADNENRRVLGYRRDKHGFFAINQNGFVIGERNFTTTVGCTTTTRTTSSFPPGVSIGNNP
jgi:hypothetical protein